MTFMLRSALAYDFALLLFGPRKAARTALSVTAAPSFRRCYGSEFTSNGILAWADQNRVEWHYIVPGKPMDTDVVE
ncbi:MAG: hypothetical protein EOS20_27265 [Mesorhizobium sp.]|nr:MAG: hypothetical protein EOS20_27265 [Mesorhizobium sp.]